MPPILPRSCCWMLPGTPPVTPAPLPSDNVLLTCASRREQVQARRLAARDHLTADVALTRILLSVAGDAGLHALYATRTALTLAIATRRALRQAVSLARYRARQAGPVTDLLAWHAWFDGSATPNPGRIGLGAVLQAPDGTQTAISRDAGMGDSSMAEYLALIAVLECALSHQVTHLVVQGDSRVVIDDLQGKVPVRTLHLKPYRLQAVHLLGQFACSTLIWIPRARNAAADRLATRATTGTAVP